MSRPSYIDAMRLLLSSYAQGMKSSMKKHRICCDWTSYGPYSVCTSAGSPGYWWESWHYLDPKYISWAFLKCAGNWPKLWHNLNNINLPVAPSSRRHQRTCASAEMNHENNTPKWPANCWQLRGRTIGRTEDGTMEMTCGNDYMQWLVIAFDPSEVPMPLRICSLLIETNISWESWRWLMVDNGHNAQFEHNCIGIVVGKLGNRQPIMANIDKPSIFAKKPQTISG